MQAADCCTSSAASGSRSSAPFARTASLVCIRCARCSPTTACTCSWSRRRSATTCLRDGRFALHSFPCEDNEDAFGVTGRATLVEDDCDMAATRGPVRGRARGHRRPEARRRGSAVRGVDRLVLRHAHDRSRRSSSRSISTGAPDRREDRSVRRRVGHRRRLRADAQRRGVWRRQRQRRRWHVHAQARGRAHGDHVAPRPGVLGWSGRRPSDRRLRVGHRERSRRSGSGSRSTFVERSLRAARGG